jgi:hypothetical protein
MSALPSECSFIVSCPALRHNLLMLSQWSQGEKSTASISEAQASIEVLSPVPGTHLKMHGNASGLHAKPISTSMAECARPSSFRRDDVEVVQEHAASSALDRIAKAQHSVANHAEEPQA